MRLKITYLRAVWKHAHNDLCVKQEALEYLIPEKQDLSSLHLISSADPASQYLAEYCKIEATLSSSVLRFLVMGSHECCTDPGLIQSFMLCVPLVSATFSFFFLFCYLFLKENTSLFQPTAIPRSASKDHGTAPDIVLQKEDNH